MEKRARKFFYSLLETPGISGFEQQVQRVVRDYAESFIDVSRTDMHGNLILAKNVDADLRIMLAGHCDQIGLIVASIDDNGYLYTQTVGGWDPMQLVGQNVVVWTADGPVSGVISRKAIHLMDENERKQMVKVRDLWVDIGADSRVDAEARVRIGDPITLQPGVSELLNNRVSSPAMDDRCGVWVVVEALRRAAEMGMTNAVYAVSTVQEEVGLRGARTAAYGIDPHVGIAVDVTHATDCPTVDVRQRGNIRLGGGPVIVRGPNVNPNVASRLIQLAENHEFPHQLAALGRAAPNDSNALQVTRQGVATGIVAIPNRYMHSGVETVCLDDLDVAADLLANFVCVAESPQAFIPMA